MGCSDYCRLYRRYRLSALRTNGVEELVDIDLGLFPCPTGARSTRTRCRAPSRSRFRITAGQHRRIDPKRGQHQRHSKQCEQHHREPARPLTGPPIAHRNGEDHNQQARNKKCRNLRPTVRPACQRTWPRDLPPADEFPAKPMEILDAGPGVQSHRDQEERPGQNAGKHSSTA